MFDLCERLGTTASSLQHTTLWRSGICARRLPSGTSMFRQYHMHTASAQFVLRAITLLEIACFSGCELATVLPSDFPTFHDHNPGLPWLKVDQ